VIAQYITIKTSHKKNLTKSVVTGELTKFVRGRSNCILGNTVKLLLNADTKEEELTQ